MTLSIQVSDADRERKEPTVNADKFQSKMRFSDGFYMKSWEPFTSGANSSEQQ